MGIRLQNALRVLVRTFTGGDNGNIQSCRLQISPLYNFITTTDEDILPVRKLQSMINSATS